LLKERGYDLSDLDRLGLAPAGGLKSMHTITISLPDNLYERISMGKVSTPQKSLKVSVTVTAAAARRKVNAYLASNLGNLLLSGEPALTITDRIVWRVPVDVTDPIDGRIGHIGDVDVDAENGELLITADQANQLAQNSLRILNAKTTATPEM
jgi:hypothetical protein